MTRTALRPVRIPDDALLRAYADLGYADCFVARVETDCPLPRWIEAFYTTPLFRVERAILRRVASKPSSDDDARALATGTATRFAAWQVEGRSATQILLADFTGRTRSWLMVAPGAGSTTDVYFGSAVMPQRSDAAGRTDMGIGFRALLGFHRVYSRLLLRAACARLRH